MRVLITGAFGNLGLMCIRHSLAFGYQVICCDLPRRVSKKRAKEFGSRVSVIYGDLRDTTLLAEAVQKVDAIIHLAAVLPPVTENNPGLAEAINVDACKQLIRAAESTVKPPVFIYPSSVTVFGLPTQGQGDRIRASSEGNHIPLKCPDDPVRATDNYTKYKIAVEQYLKQSSLPWVILRVGVSVDSRTLGTDRATFGKLLQVNAHNPLEYVHPKDVAMAMCRAAEIKEAVGKVLLIGGGESCRVTQRRFLSTAFDALGLRLPFSVHGREPYYTHWMDTEESRRILQYQKHSFGDYADEMNARLHVPRLLLLPFRWLINPLLGRILKLLFSR